MSQGQRNVLLGGIAVAAIAVAAFLFTTRGGGPSELPQEYLVRGVCLACKAETEAVHGMSEFPPYACPTCNEVAVYPWYYCYKCKRRFVPDLVIKPDGPPGFPVPVYCAACRSGEVIKWDPEFIGEEPVGTAKLPKWPP